VPLDCSVDSLDGKFIASEAFTKQRLPNAQFLDFADFIRKDNWAMRTHLKNLGIGQDNAILCYDSDKNLLACNAAVMLSSIGLKEVIVLSGRFQPWNALSAQPMKPPVKASGTVFDYTPKVDYYATQEQVENIENGKSSIALIDCRGDKAEFELRHRKNAKHIQWNTMMYNSVRKESSDILAKFKAESVDVTSQLILTGGYGAYVFKAVCDDLGINNTSIFIDPQEIAGNVLSANYKFGTENFAKKNAAILTLGFGAFAGEMTKAATEEDLKHEKDGTLNFKKIKTAIGKEHGEKFSLIFEKAEKPLTEVSPDDKQNILMFYMSRTERNVDPSIISHIVSRPTFDINYSTGKYDALNWTARQTQKVTLDVFKCLEGFGADPKKSFEDKNALEWYVNQNAKSLDKEVIKFFLKKECTHAKLSAEEKKLIK
jgi:3-mercaptopyruvate sulfurtransferase SseA